MSYRFREPVSGFSHLFGAVVALLAFIWLAWVAAGDFTRLLVIAIYGLSVIATFSASAVMHLYNGSRAVIQWLIRLDHAAIYLMIAGTYTAACYLFLDGMWLWGMLTTIWILAVAGVAWKLFFWEEGNPWSLAYYLLMGWTCVFIIPVALPQLDVVGGSLFFLGGLAYTVGAVVFGLRRPNINEWWGYHEIWHLFVLGGFAFHFWAIARDLLTMA